MFDFIKYKYVSIGFSLILIVFGFGYTYFVHGGFANSLDFNGGLRTVIEFDQNTDRKKLESYFTENKIEAVLLLLDKEKHHYQIDIGLGSLDFILQKYREKNGLKPTDKVELSGIDALISILIADFGIDKSNVLSANQVGAIVGGELSSTGITLLGLTMAIILAYISFRFQFKFALGAIVALTHDLILTVAFIGFFQIKPSVPIIAALLTLLGYSINDTIVVFDRIRENASGNLDQTFGQTINSAINQTLGRTFNTSFATLISIVAIIIGGATELFDFAYVLTFGIVIGTYSSIFIAAPLVDIYDHIVRKVRG
ncbi:MULTISPECIES: protein translocase subunit SecF [Leptospira]|uniref:Protein-export membrane protein SecF n=2 Tax=Leptospira weilii TaxID=28184 RepID=A0A828Z5H6_9LEPT|nr:MULTISPECIES: protein translocase subunit SecF [Leptospira]EMM71239.1 export membrane protein SecF [Leptospira weilii str. 2006001855]EKR64915.1 export membrane protein SecF [Leptospira weilii str. 2006001853]EMJ67485.1 export membrane protein SecF [Leptospira sp. P2653]EMN43045.1 export membrane protein SecF [Leptospira weilii str. LNT 1234]MCL8266359.1 protein translocase subunit SecF [Leptospira weilii]